MTSLQFTQRVAHAPIGGRRASEVMAGRQAIRAMII
jgi:hypothetical protein